MTASASAFLAGSRVLARVRQLVRDVRATAFVLLLFAASSSSVAQAVPNQNGVAEVLGPHNEGARGCTLCHASRSAATAPAQENADNPNFLWGNNDLSYGSSVSLADGSHLVEVRPSALTGARQEVGGVLLCLSCHDGNLTPDNMMQSWSYEHQVGLLDSTPFGKQKIPSLLGRDEAPMDDHPIGSNATITPGNGLVFSDGKFSVVPNSPYAQFIANYGWPSLAPGKRSVAFGVSGSGEPYTFCTTCHDQHVRNVYVAGASSPIAGDGSGKFYTTYFFLNGPYNPTQDKLAGYPTTSATQFCRQCHFNLSNEGNNTLNAPTFF